MGPFRRKKGAVFDRLPYFKLFKRPRFGGRQAAGFLKPDGAAPRTFGRLLRPKIHPWEGALYPTSMWPFVAQRLPARCHSLQSSWSHGCCRHDSSPLVDDGCHGAVDEEEAAPSPGGVRRTHGDSVEAFSSASSGSGRTPGCNTARAQVNFWWARVLLNLEHLVEAGEGQRSEREVLSWRHDVLTRWRVGTRRHHHRAAMNHDRPVRRPIEGPRVPHPQVEELLLRPLRCIVFRPPGPTLGLSGRRRCLGGGRGL